MKEDLIKELIENTKGKSLTENLKYVSRKFGDSVVFSSSFGMEDQVVTDAIAKNNLSIKIFTLDTGRNFEETNYVHNMTNIKYGIKIVTYHPDTKDIEELINTKGPYSFYESVENRKECCFLRKVKPLQRALKGYSCWITGIRMEQSPDRSNIQQFEWDETHQLIKFHPLFFWNMAQLEEYIQSNNIPLNELHKKGYPSIGCAPCTKAIKPGEDIRAGRWWWETGVKECGLHLHKKEKVTS
ncbi:MAG: phosphoadenylyl-sulfate reductase [Leptospiraceae bacterium]|nr:phosphoadenylyl-sulfate reductase [Leptospiraceae bacterium]MCP5495160.1 phosphoadenylyl-sulfate reductase [Leptospiraceae bacterium]